MLSDRNVTKPGGLGRLVISKPAYNNSDLRAAWSACNRLLIRNALTHGYL